MEDYKMRVIEEYKELKGKYTKLHKLIVKYDANTLGFELNCPIYLLRKQKAALFHGRFMTVKML